MSEVDDLQALIDVTNERHETVVGWDRYHRGIFEPPYLPSADRGAISREYRAIVDASDLNICAPAVSVIKDRLQVDGYRTAGGDVDETVWSWWQANKLDADQRKVYQDALAMGDGYVVVSLPKPSSPGIPLIEVASPLVMRVVMDPFDDVVKMAAKVVGHQAYIYYPDRVVYLESQSEPAGIKWRVVSATQHPAGRVPVVRFANQADSAGRSQSEIARIAPIQRRVNQTSFDRMMIQKSGTWKQRYAAGIDVEKDANGKAVPPFRIGVDQLVVSPNPDAKFGEWSESPIGELLKAVEDDIRHAAMIVQIPPHMLSPTTVSNISAEALAALESGMSAKVSYLQSDWGEAWEQSLSIAGSMVGVAVPSDAEMVWANLEARSQAQVVDAVVKLKSIGLPMSYLLERMGLTPQQIERTLAEQSAEASSAAALSAAAFGITASANPVA